MRQPILSRALLFAIAASPVAVVAQDRAAAVPAAPIHEGRPLNEWIAQLTDRVPQERIRAAYALAELGSAASDAVPALRAALKDEHAVVRYAAVWALSEIGPDARVAHGDLVARADSDRVGDVRWIAAKALRKLEAAAATERDRPPN